MCNSTYDAQLDILAVLGLNTQFITNSEKMPVPESLV